jgi:peptidylamidoglycolate lyase
MPSRKRSNAILILIILGFILGLTVMYLAGGGSEVIYKDVPKAPMNETYRSEILWPQLGEKMIAGQGSGVAIDSEGYIFYLHRAGYPYENHQVIPEFTVIQLDADTGEVMARWGADIFKSPHGLAIDSEDQIWITDVMANKIYKFSYDGELLRTYGEDYPFYMEVGLRIKNVLSRLPIPMSDLLFARPTDIVVSDSGDFTVSDGYRNKRIAKFNADGKQLWEINRNGSGGGEFNLPHGIAQDAKGLIYVADRNNARIQVFSPEGQWLVSWSQPEIGRPYGIEIGQDQQLYIADGGDVLNGRLDHPQSHIVRMGLDGQVTARWSTWGTKVGQLMIPHDIAVDQKGNVYVAELNNNRLQKFIPIE